MGSEVPKTTLWGGPGQRFEPGPGGPEAGTPPLATLLIRIHTGNNRKIGKRCKIKDKKKFLNVFKITTTEA